MADTARQVCAPESFRALSLQWCNLLLVIKMEVVKMVQHGDKDGSICSSLVLEIKSLMASHQTCITHINHSQNVRLVIPWLILIVLQ